MANMRAQAERFETRFVSEDVVSVDFSAAPFKIKTESQEILTQTVILATGASAMWLGLESEQKYIGRGVSACAVCDGLFFKGKDVIVVGGGDTAMREAQHLAKQSKKVYVVHRRDQLRAQAALQNLLKSKPNVEFIWNSVIDEVVGEGVVKSVKLKNVQTGEITDQAIDGVFVAIGHKPNTSFLKDQVELDERGYIVVRDHTKTSVEGIFVAGDVADHRYRQAVTAAGEGCKAAMEVEEYLESNVQH
jgi:thioredoxin reductase (NADPH)